MSSERRGLLLRWLLTAGIAFLAFELSRTGIADFLRLEPCVYLDRVQASGKLPDPAKLGAARDRLVLAGKFDPDNPIIQEYLGIVYFREAVIAAADLPLRIGYLETARDYYKKALALRPNSGYLWAGMAAVSGALLESRPLISLKLAAGADGATESDLRDLKQALAYATRLAPWEPAVLSNVVRIGKLHYSAFGPDVRRLVDDAERRVRSLSGLSPDKLLRTPNKMRFKHPLTLPSPPQAGGRGNHFVRDSKIKKPKNEEKKRYASDGGSGRHIATREASFLSSLSPKRRSTAIRQHYPLR
jgi:tetratricopeptide (TPR) repeat protein